jgi:hypothetical protein
MGGVASGARRTTAIVHQAGAAVNVTRQFPYLTDAELRAIVERDYVELNVRLFPARAWKSTVIMAGSILESILIDVLSAPSESPPQAPAPRWPGRRGACPSTLRPTQMPGS